MIGARLRRGLVRGGLAGGLLVLALGPRAEGGALEEALARARARCASGQGTFAFHYASRLDAARLAWLGRFALVVPGDVLPPEQVRALASAGARLFFYEWLGGFYLDRRGGGPWETFVRASRPAWLLNPGRPDPGPDGRDRTYYYDPVPGDLRGARGARLARRLEASGYHGVFFDLVGSPHLPEPWRLVHQRRHAGVDYDRAMGEHLVALRQAKPAVAIVTNQGYRVPAAYLPLTDYDLTESLVTSSAWGEDVDVVIEGVGPARVRETYYRPWEELRPLVDGIEAEVRRHGPRVRVLHLNYVRPAYEPTGGVGSVAGRPVRVVREAVDRAAVHHGYAVARLWGHDSFSALAEVGAVTDDIYFADLGRPLGQTFEERDGLIRRHYEHGVVVVNPSTTSRTADLRAPHLPDDTQLWDCFDGRPVSGLTVTIAPTRSALSGRLSPAGRVYLYAR